MLINKNELKDVIGTSEEKIWDRIVSLYPEMKRENYILSYETKDFVAVEDIDTITNVVKEGLPHRIFIDFSDTYSNREDYEDYIYDWTVDKASINTMRTINNCAHKYFDEFASFVEKKLIEKYNELTTLGNEVINKEETIFINASEFLFLGSLLNNKNQKQIGVPVDYLLEKLGDWIHAKEDHNVSDSALHKMRDLSLAIRIFLKNNKAEWCIIELED